ncbi:COPII coat assembly protein sec16-like [Schistocerca piceifrons]|uniref:COPII coat assembly protein sec16-like n=1 Tax=Schistocerca piceifrons TaxID=274613 RepID=UPI001F5E5593|nr:COPII coat assembly protein sec16-like [Schistocerca piceifrons]
MLPPALPPLSRSPRPLPPPSSLPATSLPPTADDPQLSPSVSTTDPPQEPCSIDQSLVSPQTYSSHQSRNPMLSPAPQILPLPPPSSLPSSPLPTVTENPQLSSPVFAAVAPKHPYTVDRANISSQKHLPGVQFHQLQEQLEAHPRDLGPASQGRSDPNPACNSSYSTPADAHEPTAQVLMPASPADSVQRHLVPVTEIHGTDDINITSSIASQTEKFHGSWVKPNVQDDSIRHPSQPKVAWEMQSHFFPLQQQVNLQEGGFQLGESTREGQSKLSRTDAVNNELQQQQQQSHACLSSLVCCDRVAPGKLPEGIWLMERQAVQASSPPRIFTELLPPVSSSQPAVNVPVAMTFTGDEKPDSCCPELKNDHNANPTYARSEEPQLQMPQPILPNDQQRQFLKKNTLAHEKEYVCKTCSKKFATRYSLNVSCHF